MRKIVRYIALMLGLWLFAAAAPSSHAAAPMAKTQAPGFYRMMLGDFEVTALNDGVVDYPTDAGNRARVSQRDVAGTQE
jgi:hypothetical protein